MTKKIKYTDMESYQVLEACGDAADRWADAFCQYAEKLGHPGIDQGWMIGWFANAIEYSHQLRTGRAIKRQSEKVG